MIVKVCEFINAENECDMVTALQNEYFFILMDWIRLIAIRHITGVTEYKLNTKDKINLLSKDLNIYKKVFELQEAGKFFRLYIDKT